jgi:hypothetical protein
MATDNYRLKKEIERFSVAEEALAVDYQRFYKNAFEAFRNVLNTIDRLVREGITDEQKSAMRKLTVFDEYARECEMAASYEPYRGPSAADVDTDKQKWGRGRVLATALALAAGLGIVGSILLSQPQPGLEVGKAMLSLAVVGVGGAVIGTLIGWGNEGQAKLKVRIDQRQELLTRTRSCHLRIVEAQRVLRTDYSTKTYREQMLGLMRVIGALEDIERDVAACSTLFATDNDTISQGLRCVVAFLRVGFKQFEEWSRHGLRLRRPTHGWLYRFTHADEGSMPLEYEIGIALSKGCMRFHVYVARDRKDATVTRSSPRGRTIR